MFVFCIFVGFLAYFIHKVLSKSFQENKSSLQENKSTLQENKSSLQENKSTLQENKSSLEICVITNLDECERAVSRLFRDIECGTYALGFDCEWNQRPKELVENYGQPVSLLQLCSSSGLCCLFRLNELGMPDCLRFLLRSECLKVGVNSAHDAKLIKGWYGVKVTNFLDLRNLYSQQASLAKLSETVLGVTLCKNLSVILSDWNAPVLNNTQIEYAARDAWAAIEIFKTWSNGKQQKDIFDLTEKYKNMRFRDKYQQTYYYPECSTGSRTQFTSSKRDGVKKNQLNELKFARKGPLYDNCWMLAPDGEVLNSCDKSKAEWYITKGLAIITSEDPFSIKLLFEPKSRPGNDTDGNFYRQFKKNCCVVCGSQGPYNKHYVMPRAYRKHFPENMKSHQSHDIVLTCLNCHAKSKLYMRQLQQELAELCDAPIYTEEPSSFKEYKKMKHICRTLLKSGSKIPTDRRKSLETSVKEYFGIMEINSAILEEISSESHVQDHFVSHGEKVVEYFKQQSGGLKELEVLWRKQFLQNLKPQFLPTEWSIDHNHK